MSYKYITENNLEEKQNYMYSEYGGNAFLEEYQDSRKAAIINTGEEDTDGKLYDLLLNVPSLQHDKDLKFSLDKLVQSFEVRKRVYDRTDLLWKPVDKNAGGYKTVENYILFGEILVQAYLMTKNLKYFNCLLKLDDTLISMKSRLDANQKRKLSSILKKEQLFYEELKSKEVKA